MNQYTFEIYEQIVTLLIAGVAPAIVTYFIGKYKKLKNTKDKEYEELKSNIDALNQGMRAILRKTLLDAYNEYYVDKVPLTVERKKELTHAWTSYERNGGNGAMKDIWRKIQSIDVKVIGKDWDKKA